MGHLNLIPDKLPLTETLEYNSKALVADGGIVIQYLRGKDKIIIDLALSIRLGKGLLGRAEVKAVSHWHLTERWTPHQFTIESSLWGINKKSSFDLKYGQLDPLSATYALRCDPISEVGDRRVFITRDEKREKTIELYAIEKRRDAVDDLKESIKLEFREEHGSSKRLDQWQFWVEPHTNVLNRIDIGHEKLGNISFYLSSRR